MIQIEPTDYCDDDMAGLKMSHKKKQMLLHVTAIKRHISAIDMEEAYDISEKRTVKGH